jgi:hypothetical protein
MSDLFRIATRSKYRYASERGLLTTEDLWDLPLTSRNKFDLNNVAITLNSELKSLAEESFVETSTNPRRKELENQLEIVKLVIATKQTEKQAATDRAAKAALKARIQEAIDTQESAALSNAPLEQLRAQLAELEATSV